MRDPVPVYVCPGCKARIPFGTPGHPPPEHCPGCGRQLGIPSVVDVLPPEWPPREDRPGTDGQR